MRVMLATETDIPVITTNFYDDPWECLEGHGNITFHKKFDMKLFPEGIPARSGGMATRYKLLHDLALVTMADVVLGETDLQPEELWRGLIRDNRLFSLRQALCLVNRGFTAESNPSIREDYRTDNFFFVEAEEDCPCVVVASPDIGRRRFVLRTLRWGRRMPCGNYGNLFVPAPST